MERTCSPKLAFPASPLTVSVNHFKKRCSHKLKYQRRTTTFDLNAEMGKDCRRLRLPAAAILIYFSQWELESQLSANDRQAFAKCCVNKKLRKKSARCNFLNNMRGNVKDDIMSFVQNIQGVSQNMTVGK